MKIEGKKLVFDGHYQLNLVNLKTKAGDIIEREQFKTPNSVAVLVHDPSKELIYLVKQFRLGPEKDLLEIVAGKIEVDEQNPRTTAEREVMEEVGCKVNEIRHLHEFYTTPGPITECMNLYYASVKEEIDEGGGLASEHEEIEVLKVSEEEFLNTEFFDAKSLIAQKWFQQNQTKLKS